MKDVELKETSTPERCPNPPCSSNRKEHRAIVDERDHFDILCSDPWHSTPKASEAKRCTVPGCSSTYPCSRHDGPKASSEAAPKRICVIDDGNPVTAALLAKLYKPIAAPASAEPMCMNCKRPKSEHWGSNSTCGKGWGLGDTHFRAAPASAPPTIDFRIAAIQYTEQDQWGHSIENGEKFYRVGDVRGMLADFAGHMVEEDRENRGRVSAQEAASAPPTERSDKDYAMIADKFLESIPARETFPINRTETVSLLAKFYSYAADLTDDYSGPSEYESRVSAQEATPVDVVRALLEDMEIGTSQQLTRTSERVWILTPCWKEGNKNG